VFRFDGVRTRTIASGKEIIKEQFMGSNFLLIFLVVAGILVFGCVGIGLFLARKFSNLPDAAWKQGYKNAFFTLLIILPILAGVVLLVKFIFNLSLDAAFFISLGFLWAVVYIFFLYGWINNKKKAGHVLLDMGPFQNKLLLIVVGCAVIVFNSFRFFLFDLRHGDYVQYIFTISNITLGTWFLFMAFSRIQIRENGILIYIDFLKWEKIESFDWASGNPKTCVLKLRVKGRLPASMRNGVLPVPVEKKAEFESILERYSSKMSLEAKNEPAPLP